MSRERLKRGALPPAQENIDKLQKVVNEGNYYGAQQMYKSVSVRYVSAQRYSEALDLLQSGACIQLAHGQVTCGAELALLFVETLVKAKVPYDNETLERLEKIYKAFPRVPLPQNLRVDDDMQQISEALGAAKTRVEGCSSFLKAAIRWSAEFGANNYGSPELHIMLAEYIYYESPEVDMARVTNHFVRGNNPKKFASILVDFMGKRYPGEDDLAIARAVLR
ncbi:Golgi to ER traffic protein 4 homolog [Neltuma alba]|nr:Golgi to ER traffic protein 4 homolog [Prosopis alba]XP_028782632.1 Golgi to ER traffic protein 4 homolog [Prosopis alba]